MKRAILVGAAVVLLAACDTGTPATTGTTPTPSGATSAAAATGSIDGTARWTNIDCAVVAFAGCQPPPVTITVKTSPDGKPVTSVHLPEGHYRIDGLPAGTYSVEAYTDAPGDAGGAFGSSVPVQAGLTTPNIDFALQPPASICLVRYQGKNATVSFNGPGADHWCSKLTQIDGNWFRLTDLAPASGLSSVCSGTSHAGVAWGVFDSGGQVYGHQACATVNQLSAS